MLPAEPVDELGRLTVWCAALVAENEQWGEVGRLSGENGRQRARIAKLEGQLEEAAPCWEASGGAVLAGGAEA